MSKFPTANIAFITGEVSNLTVIDIDSGRPDIINDMIRRFGDTPVKVSTPSGGMHLYYRFSGEHSCTRIDGLPVDIRSEGGYVVAPPSINPQSGQPYRFIEGRIKAIKSLPNIKKNSVSAVKDYKKNPDLLSGDIVKEGQRNNALFKALLIRVRECSCIEELEDTAFLLNQVYMLPPLPESEVEQVINNVWRLKIENRLYNREDRFLTIYAKELDTFADNPRAFWLYNFLRSAHVNRRETFAISARAIGNKIGWDAATVRDAREYLIFKGYLELIKLGGGGAGDVNLYRFYKGGLSLPNSNVKE